MASNRNKLAKLLLQQMEVGQAMGVPYVVEGRNIDVSDLPQVQNRIPGDSNVSNLDVKMMQLGTFSSDKEPSTNKTLLEFQIAQRRRDAEFNKYMADYAAVNGAITPYAEAQWRRYLDSNPITVRDDKGRVSINPNRMTYQQYFSMPRVRVDSQGRETPQ